MAEQHDLKDDYDGLKEEHRKLKESKAELQADRDLYLNAFARVQALAQNQGQDGNDSVIVTTTPRPAPKSTKLPKGAKLSDGVDPTFESWLIDMRSSLRDNKDHYETPSTRMAFVKRMCEGRANKCCYPVCERTHQILSPTPRICSTT